MGTEVVAGESTAWCSAPRRTGEEAPDERHFVYVFSIDSFGKCLLRYPREDQGAVENRFPLAGATSPAPDLAASDPLFVIDEPFGVYSYYLLATTERIPNPGILNCKGVHEIHRGEPLSAIEELLLQSGSDLRGNRRLSSPSTWSLQRLHCVSVPRAGSDPSR